MKRCIAFCLACLGAALGPQLACAKAAEVPVELRAFVNDSCIVADEPFLLPEQAGGSETKAVTLVTIVVGKLAEALIARVIRAGAGKVSTTAARRDTRYAVAKEMNLYRADLYPRPTLNLNAQLGCMTVVAGRFAADDATCHGEYLPRTLDRATMRLPDDQWQTSRADDTLANPLRRANVCMLEEPKAVFESRFEFSPDGTTYRLSNAGYRVNSLLTTPAKKAERNVFYTLEIAQPARSGESEKLSIALVDLGKLAAGARAPGPEADKGRWQRVPELSSEARRAFEQQTKVHHDVAAEIEALQRAITRHERMTSSLETRVAGTSGPLKGGLQQELLKNRVQVVALQGELAARRAEYDELPRDPLQFMPVAIEVGVTETRSERPLLLAMSQGVDRNSGTIASTTTTLIGMPKALDLTAAPDPVAELASARAAYFDALVEIRSSDEGQGTNTTEVLRLAALKQRFDAARTAMGLEALLREGS
jgi:hypothetical protein